MRRHRQGTVGKARTTTQRKKPAKAKKQQASSAISRNMLVFAVLIGSLALTSVLLLAISPPPLTPGAAMTLIALDSPEDLAALFHTTPPVQKDRWQYIYIHHSRTSGGNAETLGQPQTGLGDHFVIGNGEGCMDGAIQISQRWKQQLPPLAPPGAGQIDPRCISICLVGDFDRAVPTPVQMRRLTQLVGALQAELGVPSTNVLMVDQPGTPAGIGRYFPQAPFRQQLLN